MKSKTQLLILVLAVAIAVSPLTSSTLARIIPPQYVDMAYFLGDPYLRGMNTITFEYQHDSPGWTMLIVLYDTAGHNQGSWQIPPFASDNINVPITNGLDGIWTLCYNTAYGQCSDHALYHGPGYATIENLSDPVPAQANLGSDWARHPGNGFINNKALSIIGYTVVSSYQAALDIHDHVYANFIHDQNHIDWRTDLDLLNDLNTLGKYYGVCRSDAVILTSYARSLGIPARIIHLIAIPRLGGQYVDHFFAEFYLKVGSTYQWVPVDGDPGYNWFGIDQANQKISALWPADALHGQISYEISISIVTQVNGVSDGDIVSVPYPDSPYSNEL